VPAALVPLGPVTRTETLLPPIGPGGTTALITVSETTLNEVAAVKPKVTAVAFVKPKPLITAVFPPAIGPLVGLTVLTTGAATLL
jgi:hypothetical protein